MTFRQKKRVKFLFTYRGDIVDHPCLEGKTYELQAGWADALIENGWAVEPEIEVTDAALALAMENEIPLGLIKGSGANGRVLVGDVEQAIEDRDYDDYN